MAGSILQPEFLQKEAVENSVWFNGNRLSILLDSPQTESVFTLIYCYLRKGGEPPVHFHRNHHETFYILEGEIRYHIGEKKFIAKDGDVASIPKQIPHQFKLVSETAKAILLITPSGLETFFKEFSIPAQSLELPPITDAKPALVFTNKMIIRAEELGIVWMPEF